MVDVDTVRQRFLSALEQGKSTQEATVYANAGQVSRRTPGTLPPPDDDVAALRVRYKEKFGKRAFAGWTADQLREKLA